MLIVEYWTFIALVPVLAALGWVLSARGWRGSVALRLTAALAAALAGVALAGVFKPEGSSLRVFLVDISASTRGAAESLMPGIRSAASKLPKNSHAAVVVFGREASILVPPTPVAELPEQLPRPAGPNQHGTSIQKALDTAQILFPASSSGDIVLVTDGFETSGDALMSGAVHGGKKVHSLTILTAPATDAWIEAVRAPSSAPAGATVDIEIILGSSFPMHGKLVLMMDGKEIASPEPVDIDSGRITLTRRVNKIPPGLRTISARLLIPGDILSENNESSAAIIVLDKMNVTYVGNGLFGKILEKNDVISVRRVQPEAISATTSAILASDVIVLDNIAASRLGAGAIAWLEKFVTDSGRGLVVLGGCDSFGPGGYANTPLAGLLPVDSDPERKAADPSSVVIVADKSGSMAERIDSQQKIEFVREAVLRAGSEFKAKRGGRADEISVVAFDHDFQILLRRQQMGTPEGQRKLQDSVAELFPSGRTTLNPPLRAARNILAESGLKRHMIVVSDGNSQDTLEAKALAAEMSKAGIVVSILGTGPKMNDGLLALKSVAESTNGRFVLLNSLVELPAAMQRETRTIAGALVREGSFKIYRGKGQWHSEPELADSVTGFVQTAAREEAPPVVLAGDAPLFAVWRRGLGRVAAFTSSLDDWAADSDAMILEEAVVWAGSGGNRTAKVFVTHRDGRIFIEVDAPAEASPSARVISPGGRIIPADLRRTGLTRYEASLEAGSSGTYYVQIADSVTNSILGSGHTTIGYSPEWLPRTDNSVPRRISRMTGGAVLSSFDELPPLGQGSGGGSRKNYSPHILAASAVLFALACLIGHKK